MANTINKNPNLPGVQTTQGKSSNFSKYNARNTQGDITPNKPTSSDLSEITSGYSPQQLNNFSAALSQALKQNGGKDGTDLAYKKLAKDFETEFLSVMWNIMSQTVETENSLLGGGLGEETFKPSLVGNQVREAYAAHESGISQAIYKALKKEERLNGDKSNKGAREEEPD
jgi:Rod binding domain-containing protein